MGTKNIWGQTDRQTDKHADRHINTMNRPGLRAGPIENNNLIKKDGVNLNAENVKVPVIYLLY